MIKATLLYLIQIINFLILGRVIMSWVSQDTRNPIVNFFYQTTEPIMGPIRDVLNRLGLGGTMLDFSPIVAILLIQVIGSAIASL